jgi:hypothetical protein
VQQFLKVFSTSYSAARPPGLPSSKFLVFVTLLANELVPALHWCVRERQRWISCFSSSTSAADEADLARR